MKYLIVSLSLLLFTSQALSKMVPTGNHLVRFICQNDLSNIPSSILIFDRVVILEQTSSKVPNTDSAESETIEGSVLIDPNSEVFFTDDAAFRMRIYNNASLVSSEKTEEQIIGELLAGKSSLDSYNRPMDYTGIGGRMDDLFTFRSTGPYEFERNVDIFLGEKAEGYIDTNLGASNMSGDGTYNCKEPVLVPEMVEE